MCSYYISYICNICYVCGYVCVITVKDIYLVVLSYSYNLQSVIIVVLLKHLVYITHTYEINIL